MSSTVIVTRPSADAGSLIKALEEVGTRVIHVPVTAITTPADPGPLERAIDRLPHFDWMVLTSPNGVRAVRQVVGPRQLPAKLRIAAVGPGSRRELQRVGWPVDLVPLEYHAEGLLVAMDDAIDLRGASVLLPLAEAALPTLELGLEERGAVVTRVDAYRSVPTEPDEVRGALEDVERVGADLLTFTSPSTARAYRALAGVGALEVPTVTIGPTTADAARKIGFTVVGIAQDPTVEGLAATVRAYLRAPAGRDHGGGER